MKSRMFFLALALCASVFVMACGSSGPSGTLKSYIGHMEKGDSESAMKMVSTAKMPAGMKDSKEFKDKMKQVGDEAAKDIKGKGGIKSVNIKDEKINGDNADVKFTITYGNGTEEKEETAKLIKENGEWKIAG